jgi:nitronate monooxygenase
VRTKFTDLFGISHPIVSAAMGMIAGGALAAAVSSGGGLGLVGAASGEAEWIDRELGLVAQRTNRPWGVGFLSWSTTKAMVSRALEFRPHALLLAFGDPTPFAALAHDARIPLIIQVTDLDEARQAVDVGAAVVVAQGNEAGGHGGGQSTLPFVPAVIDLVGPIPVLAAGGIADGRGLAASLALGAAGALIGTRFQATPEALVRAEISKALLNAHGADTERSRITDIARGAPWPQRYSARTLTNGLLNQWRDREDELQLDTEALSRYRDAAAVGDLNVAPVWAGQSVGLIHDLVPAADLVATIAAHAEQCLTEAPP